MGDVALGDEAAFFFEEFRDVVIGFLPELAMQKCDPLHTSWLTLTYRPLNSGTSSVNFPDSSIGHGGISSRRTMSWATQIR